MWVPRSCSVPPPQNTPHTSKQNQTYFCLKLLPWILAHLAHMQAYLHIWISCRLLPFPAQLPHGWCPSVVGGTVQLPPLRQQGTSVLQQSGLMGPLQFFQLHVLSSKCASICLGHRASLQLVHLHLLHHSPFQGIQGCIGEQRLLERDLRVPLLKASRFTFLSLFKSMSLCIIPRDSGVVAFVSCLLFLNILKTSVRLLETVIDY